jgi:hypothetical protein
MSNSVLKLVCNVRVNSVYGNLKSENFQDYAQKPQRKLFVHEFGFCSAIHWMQWPGVVGQHWGENPPKFRHRIGFQIVHHHILPPLSSVSAAESQSLSIETGLQPKRIWEGREPEKEFLDINFTKDRVFCSMVDFKENQTLLWF